MMARQMTVLLEESRRKTERGEAQVERGRVWRERRGLAGERRRDHLQQRML